LSREQDWKQATAHYERYIAIRENEANVTEENEDNEGEEQNVSVLGIPFHDQHEIVARLAYLYETGGFGLTCDYQRSGE
jgi:hypothetical protein